MVANNFAQEGTLSFVIQALSKNRSIAQLMFPFVLLMLLLSNISIALSQLSLGVALLLLLVGRATGKLILGRTGLEKSALAVALWALLMIPFSSDPVQSAFYFQRFFLFSTLWVVATVSDREQWRKYLLIAVVIGAVGISIYGLSQIYMETGALFQTRLGAMSNPMTSGCLLMMSLLVIGGFVFTPGLRPRGRALLLIAALPVSLALVQTLTRSAWLGMLAGGFTILALVRPKLTGIFLAVVVAGFFIISQVSERYMSEGVAVRFTISEVLSSRSSTERQEMWLGGWQMVKSNPLTGVGDRDLTSLAPEYYGGPETDYYGHLHSNPVMLAVIWGIPGLLLVAFFQGQQLILMWRRWRNPQKIPELWQRGWVLAGMGVWTGFLVAGLTEWYFGDAESMLLYLGIMGAALATNGEVDADKRV